jgi:3-phenylpropionate/trans-cinnamate dioxygenase ferredoxin component
VAFVRALKKSDLEPNQGRCVVLEGKRIAVFRCGEEFFAIDDTCTHQEAALSEGCAMEDEKGRCVVECPWHGAHFDLRTGAAVTLPAIRPVNRYKVRVEGDCIEVEL